MSVRVYSVFVLSSAGSGLATDSPPAQGVLRTVYKIHKFPTNFDGKQDRGPNKNGRIIIIIEKVK
jgi:hypothetical protein